MTVDLDAFAARFGIPSCAAPRPRLRRRTDHAPTLTTSPAPAARPGAVLRRRRGGDGRGVVRAPAGPPEALAASCGEDDDTDAPPYEIRGDVAVVPVRGALSQRGGRFWLWSWAGYDTVSAALAAALADRRERRGAGHRLPGGAVAGMLDAARAMRAAVVAAGKPCVAVASGWPALRATPSPASPTKSLCRTGCVGSVGVIGTMTSLARMYAAAGADVRVIASGAAKATDTPRSRSPRRA